MREFRRKNPRYEDMDNAGGLDDVNEQELAKDGGAQSIAEKTNGTFIPKTEISDRAEIEENKKREEIEENMPLEISGEPDSVIRVMMTYKGLRKIGSW